MAAVIAQLSSRLRERKRREREGRNYSSAKCVYLLAPFDPHFDPTVHNPYLAPRARFGMDELEAQAERLARADLKRNMKSKTWPEVTLVRLVVEVVTLGELDGGWCGLINLTPDYLQRPCLV